MALIDIIQMPDLRLNKPSRRVKRVDDEMRHLIVDMEETMRKYDGIGLAAVQVGVHKRFILICVPDIVEEALDTDEAIKILESDNADSQRGVVRIEKANPEEAEGGPVITYVRRSLVWPAATIYINPRVVEKEGHVIDDEGCLSDMGYQAKVERARRVVVAALDLDLNPVRHEAMGLEARALQHEIDHLDGIVYHERMIEGTRECMHPGDEAGGDDGDEEGSGDEEEHD
jgi:peptide deformylase